MASGIELTFHVLARTPNESAVPILVDALDSPQRFIQEHALRSLLDRRSQEGHLAVLTRWDTFSEHFRQLVRDRPGRISAAIREAVVSGEERLVVNGCAVAVATREFDLIPVLIALAERIEDPHADRAAQTLLELSELLHEELSTPRDYRERRDPQLVRQHVVGSLELALGRITLHRRVEIVEAFLMLAKTDNTLMRKTLDDPRCAAYRLMMETLETSPRLGVMRILLKYIEKAATPASVLQIVAHRADIPFLRRLCRSMGSELSDSVRRNLHRIDRWAWLGEQSLLHALNEEEQSAAMRVTAASAAPRNQVLAMIGELIRNGNVGGRRAAAETLAAFGGVEANELAMIALDNEDGAVQCAIVKQLRDRGIPGAMARLILLVDSKLPKVQRAACEALREFTFARYLQAFDELDEDVRRTTGQLVRKIDGGTIGQLTEELASPSRIRRMRGLQMAAAMGAAAEMEEMIIPMLQDDDHFLRAEAARALGNSRSSRSQYALREALSDRSAAVQDAAEHALRAMFEPTPAPAAFTPPPDLASLLVDGPSPASIPN